MERPRLPLAGTFTALVTPFSPDGGELDLAALDALVEAQIAGGVTGLVPCGTTGESPTLTDEEQLAVIKRVVAVAAGRVPVLAGTGSFSTKKSILASRAALEAGADGVMIVMPYYNKPSQDGMREHVLAIARSVACPIVLYNIPGRAVVGISVETMARLAKHPNIIGVKDATADLMRPSRERLACGKDWLMVSGEDGTALGYNAHGGQGCISVTANVAPRLCAEFQAACAAGDFAKARDYQDRLMPLHDALFCETSPAPVKYAVSLLGRGSEEVRLPLAEASEAARAQVKKAMQGAGIIN